MAILRAGRVVLILMIVFAIIAIALVHAGYRRDIDQARARVAAGSRIVQTPCGAIEYAEAGEGKPVLVVHGAGGGFDQGLDFSKALVGGGFRVIAMSRFGYLRTPLPADASPTAQADAYACLLDALGIRRAAIVGASAGAPSSLQFALRHPGRVNALVLMVPVAYIPRPMGVPPISTPGGTTAMFDTMLESDFLFWSMIRLPGQFAMRAMLATPSVVVDSASAEDRAFLAQVLEHTLPVSERRLGLMNDVRIIFSLPRYELERIAAPTLVMSTADDLFGTYNIARYTAEHIPHARFIGYPSGGHLWVGHHREFSSEMIAFLK